ncbi:MAG: hypothetical protein HYW06_08725 [Gemmatimonadetes bacterium]|nr:hypothetical protein [Gemmatimonadota bacterium]MBI2616261.1 hypothetical protein [Gemmatimonadota bacterium]
MDAIQTPSAPTPSGHYSQAMVHNRLVFVAGQLPIDPKDPKRPARAVVPCGVLNLGYQVEIVTIAALR